MFRGSTSYQASTVVGNLCLPNTSPSAAAAAAGTSKAVGGFINSSCSTGLLCIPSSSSPTGSQAQLRKLTAAGPSAAGDTAVAGTCRKFTAAECGQPFMPCGRDAAAAGVSCPKGPVACVDNYYCAADYDAVVGERCLPLPANAGKAGGPCLPNNFPKAPIVDLKKNGQKVAPAFCPGTATCFMSVVGDKRGFTHTQPDLAKTLASRISGTVCLDVPADCGSAPGKPCCPSDFGAVTDKPLPSYGTNWAGNACSNETSKYGMFCSDPRLIADAQSASPAAGSTRDLRNLAIHHMSRQSHAAAPSKFSIGPRNSTVAPAAEEQSSLLPRVRNSRAVASNSSSPSPASRTSLGVHTAPNRTSSTVRTPAQTLSPKLSKGAVTPAKLQPQDDSDDEDPFLVQREQRKLPGLENLQYDALEQAAARRIQALPYMICRAADGQLYKMTTG
eukprot:gene6371-6603_t